MAGVVAVLMGLALGPDSIGVSSFSELDIEFSEAKVTLQVVAAENKTLKEQLAESQQAVKSLTEGLAIANGEAEVFRREAAELKLRMEALGVEGLGGDRSKLEQRLLKAVRDLQILQGERDQLAEELVQLSEAVLRYTKSATSDDIETRLELEARMRSVAEALGVPSSENPSKSAKSNAYEQADLTNAKVISIKEEYQLVLANIGSRHGVKVGMPFRVLRDGKEIGIVRVVDVREKICGAVIQSLDTEKKKIKVGDRLKVDASKF